MATDPLAALNGTISTEQLKLMGLESVVLGVQSNKATLLEELLKDQMLTLQGKNDDVAAYNSLMASLNGFLSRFSKDATPTSTTNIAGDKTALASAMQAAGVSSNTVFGTNDIPNDPTKSQLDTAVTKIKSNIDNLSNTQQLDMLRVQSISNKRNEAFELMTTFIKKFSDLNSSIIRNL